LEVIQLLLDSDTTKESIFEKNVYGQVPIHSACSSRHTPVEVIQLLLDSDSDKRTILQKGYTGQLPIHSACDNGAHVEVIRVLLDSDTTKESIFEKDYGGRLPIQVASERGASLDVIQYLLRASVCDQIERLGLERWKIDLEELITSMTEDDSERQVQQIYKRLSKYEKMERISLLELAIWKTSCLNAGSTKFDSMRAMEDYLLARDEAFDPSEYKREYQIKSGADAIIQGVLPFLEECESQLCNALR
jgi:hypothetical protein